MSQGINLNKGINMGYTQPYLESAPEMTETDHPTKSSQQLKTNSTTCLSIFQIWCDVFNFLVGVTCIINGSTKMDQAMDPREAKDEDGLKPSDYLDIFFDRMRIWTGIAYCVVHLVSLVGFCLCKKYGLEKSLFWSRVSVFPVLFILFVCAGISSTNDDSVFRTDIQYPLQFSVTVIGYIWHLLLFGVFLYTKCRCSCDHSKADQSMTDLFKKSDIQI